MYLKFAGGKGSVVRVLTSEGYVQEGFQGDLKVPFKKDRLDTECGHLHGFTDTYYPAQYYQFAHNIIPGSVRIAVTKYTGQIDAAAYLTPEDKIVVILLSKADELLLVNLRIQGKAAEILLPGKALASCD